MKKIIINSKEYIKYPKKYIKISRNQLLIFDALLNDGGMSKKYLDSNKKIRYSEHSGLLDFNASKLEKIIISGNTKREDEDDTDILLPHDLPDSVNYEYMFHTHPPTPYPGGRAKDGILYEFPSISDIYHFIHYFNLGETQGSIIIAPEGIYIIKARTGLDKITYDEKKENDIYDILQLKQLEIQEKAINEYGVNFTSDRFLRYISQDKKYVKFFNKLLYKYFNKQIKVTYKPRSYDKQTGQWMVDSLYLSVESIEPKKNKLD